MCETCYREFGSPVKITPAVLAITDDLAEATDDLRLYSVTQNWNIEDEHVAFFLNFKDATDGERDLASRLLTLDLDERATAMALVDGYIPYPA